MEEVRLIDANALHKLDRLKDNLDKEAAKQEASDAGKK